MRLRDVFDEKDPLRRSVKAARYHWLVKSTRRGTSPPPSPFTSGVAGPDQTDLDVSLVIPFFNPGIVVRDTVIRSARVLTSQGVSFEIIAISDGSTDGSETALEDLLPGTLHTVVLPQNRGKGAALRVGFAMAQGRRVGFIDADGDIPPEILPAFVDAMAGGRVDISLGSKRHRESDVDSPLLRKAYSWGYQLLAQVLFGLHVRDSQTGIEFLRRDVLDAVLPRTTEQRFALDIEMLVVARQLGFDTFLELPVRIHTRSASTVSLTTVSHILRDTMSIFWRLRVRHFYGRRSRGTPGRRTKWRPAPDGQYAASPEPILQDRPTQGTAASADGGQCN